MVVNDAEALTKIIFEEFLDEFIQGMQKETIPYYLEQFSSEQLADLAAFSKLEQGSFAFLKHQI